MPRYGWSKLYLARASRRSRNFSEETQQRGCGAGRGETEDEEAVEGGKVSKENF